MASITVSNAAELANAISAATGGDKILLAAGNYGDLTIQNKTFSAPVEIISLDPANQALIRSLNVVNAHNLTFKSVEIGFTLPVGMADYAKMAQVNNSSYITFDSVSFHGSLDGFAGNDCDGLSVLDSHHITVIRSEFQQVKHSAMFGNTNYVDVIDNYFHDIRMGGVHFAQAEHVRISANRFTNFSVLPGDHPDAIQFWESSTTRPSRDILIMDNVIMQGTGTSTQGIFLGNDNNAFGYEDVRILNNLVYVAGYNGIHVGGGTRVTVEGNTAISWNTDSFLNRIYVYGVEQGVVRKNVTDVMIQHDNINVAITDNWILNENPQQAAQIRDLNAVAVASVEGLTVPGIGYQVPSVRVPADPPRYGDANTNAFYLGATLDPSDRIYGYEGRDAVGIQGNYNLVLGADNLIEVESLALLSGSDVRYGDTAGNRYSYNITTIDPNVGAGEQKLFNGASLLAGENFTFNASAETDGTIFVIGGKGVDKLTGGAGNDIFFFAEDGRYSASDSVDGGGGRDTIVMRGRYTVAFGPDAFTNVEAIVFNSATDTRYFAAGLNYGYTFASHDNNIAAGATMIFNGSTLLATETLVFDGSAETDGILRLFGGAANDALTGGRCADLLYGGLGADLLVGGGGGDTFLYQAAAESTGTSFDTIIDFDCTVDRIDLPGDRGIAGAAGGTLSAASFDADLAAALNGVLGVDGAVLFVADAGDYLGRTFAVVDANGQAGYQSGQDFVIEFVNSGTPIQPIDFFV
ncbi:MAG TPA: right-handed parallel beta-helix repeat-containing protein [Allosphingosinicella sp.]